MCHLPAHLRPMDARIAKESPMCDLDHKDAFGHPNILMRLTNQLARLGRCLSEEEAGVGQQSS